MANLQYHPEAQEEYQHAYQWYALRSKQAALRFELEVERVLNLIADNPAMFAAYDENHRLAVLRRYPFCIVYQVFEECIYVIAIAHSRRAPHYWLSRVTS